MRTVILGSYLRLFSNDTVQKLLIKYFCTRIFIWKMTIVENSWKHDFTLYISRCEALIFLVASSSRLFIKIFRRHKFCQAIVFVHDLLLLLRVN